LYRVVLFYCFLLVPLVLLAEEKIDSVESKKPDAGSVYQARKYRDILNLIDTYYYRELDIDSLSEETFKIMLQSLDDFSYFYDKGEYLVQQNTDKGSSVSFGLNYIPVDGKALVYNVFPEGPARKSGLPSGSLLLSISGRDVTGDSLSGLRDLLNGEEGSSATVVYDFLNSIDSVEIERYSFLLPSVSTAFAIDDSSPAAYVAIDRFSDNTSDEFSATLNNLASQLDIDWKDFKSIIIDLRGNTGGKFRAARDLATFFLDSNQLVSKTMSRSDRFALELRTTRRGELYGIPLIVLVDSETASSSEIFSGVVQDYDLGVLVGQKTFGKGVVQNTWNFKDSTGIRFTVASYMTPSGREVEPRLEYDEESLSEEMFFGLTPEQEASLRAQIEKLGTTKGKVDTYKTRSGRTVFGLKGIWPDIILSDEEYTKMHKILKSKKMYFLVAYIIMKESKNDYLELLSKGENWFIANWWPSEANIERFEKLARSNSLWNDDMFMKDKELMMSSIKAELGLMLFGYGVQKEILARQSSIFDRIEDYYLKALEIMESNDN